MQVEIFELESTQDGLGLSVMIMKPEEKPKAILQVVHGMSEHKERYINFMEYMVEKGFVCIIHDHRGHGDSVHDASEYGYFGKNGAVSLVKDMKQVGDYIRDDYPMLPFFMLGHSMGSLIARMYLKKYDSTLDGLILVGSPSNNKAVGFGIVLTKLLSKLQGEKHVSHFIDLLAFGQNDSYFPEHIKNAWLSRDTAIVKEYNACEKCGFVFTLNGFESLFLITASVYCSENWKVNKPELPILFLSGEKDPVRINDKSFYEAVGLLLQVGYQKVDAELFQDMRHEILNEMNNETVYQRISETLESWIAVK